jgi:sugar phosphate isomerase/epimerase
LAAGGKPIPVYVFSKPLDRFETSFMADTLAGAGCDGFDLTVRPGGKVVPERAAEELPKFAEAIRGHQLALGMMVTAITAADSPFAEPVLKAAAQTGITHYRMGYLEFDQRAGIRESLRRHQATLRELADLNRQCGVQGGYQNHSGIHVGAAVWDLCELLRDLPVEWLSAQYDVRHAVTEGSSCWVLGMRLIRPHIGSLAIKDFTWDVSPRRARVADVPLGDGIVDFDAFFRLVKESGIRVPVTLHLEYPLLTREEESAPLVTQQRIITAKLRKDVEFLRARLAKLLA